MAGRVASNQEGTNSAAHATRNRVLALAERQPEKQGPLEPYCPIEGPAVLKTYVNSGRTPANPPDNGKNTPRAHAATTNWPTVVGTQHEDRSPSALCRSPRPNSDKFACNWPTRPPTLAA